jgi:hypothetical protein
MFDTYLSVTATEIIHQTAMLFYDETELKICQVFGIEPGSNQFFQINNVLGPEKLITMSNRQLAIIKTSILY